MREGKGMQRKCPDGIPYCTMVAMAEGSGTESNGYSIIDIEPNGTILLNGYRKQKNYNWVRQT
jgi:alkaline phosphatase